VVLIVVALATGVGRDTRVYPALEPMRNAPIRRSLHRPGST